MRLVKTDLLIFLVLGLGGIGACAKAEDIGGFVHSSGFGAGGFGATTSDAAVPPGAGGSISGNGGFVANGGFPANGGFSSNGGSAAGGLGSGSGGAVGAGGGFGAGGGS